MNTKHTPGPWPIGEFEENGGYDCMTCGIQVGPIKLDGADYGQELLEEPTAEQVTHMYADAKLIGAAPELLEALIQAKYWLQGDKWRNSDDSAERSAWQMQMNFIDAVIKKATE